MIVVGVIRYSNSSNASSVTFPESLDELQNTTYSNAITAQISIPSDLLLERKAEGGNVRVCVCVYVCACACACACVCVHVCVCVCVSDFLYFLQLKLLP